tara:strand:- start:349 stop:726 length:378 start_codon:yes stop_codon:yes gene_type:complete
MSVDGHGIQAEVATKMADRNRGLMYRRNLEQNSGMLFVYERPARLNFWMKNTLIPLDIAFICDNGRVAHIAEMDPQTTRVHRSPLAVRYALEVNQGWFNQRRIGINSVAQFTLPHGSRSSQLRVS